METSSKKYYLFHLFNDFSGSPSVLRQVAEVLSVNNQVTIVSSNSEGFLTDIPNCKYEYAAYAWDKNRFVTLYRFLRVQAVFFFKALFLQKNSILYVNTLLPFGAALAGKVRGFEIVYHLHEPQVSPQKLFSFLKWVTKHTASKQIFVSNYLQQELSELCIEKHKVIYNSLSSDFIRRSKIDVVVEKPHFQVLMACSMKKYKGIYEFLNLAKEIPHLDFKLILNSSGEIFDSFCSLNTIPNNCVVLPSQSDMIPHYQEASLLLNLSDKDEWIESFGLTLIEAMCHGIPVIGPEVGGPKEIVEDGITGYCIDSKNTDKLKKAINLLFEDKITYHKFSIAAKLSTNQFLAVQFEKDILNILK